MRAVLYEFLCVQPLVVGTKFNQHFGVCSVVTSVEVKGNMCFSRNNHL